MTRPPDREELLELQERLGKLGLGQDIRAGGALTLSDVAEGAGVQISEAEVALEQLRAEKAFAPRVVEKQWPLAILACLLFATAWGIRVTTPHKLSDDEIDSKLDDMNSKRKSRPQKIHYPIQTTIRKGPGSTLAGFAVEFRGAYSVTRGESANDAPMLDVAGAKKFLNEAGTVLMQKALETERTANPPPGTPRATGTGQGFGYPKDSMVVAVGNSVGYIPTALDPQNPIPGSPDLSTLQASSLKSLIDSAVDNVWAGQLESLKLSKSNSDYISPPPGFTVSLQGRTKFVGQSQPLSLLPIDPSLVKARLVQSIKFALRQDEAPLQYVPAQVRAARERLPMPPFSEITIQFPGGQVVHRIPSAPSKEYPSMADVGRAVDKAIQTAVDDVADQVGRLKPGEPVRPGGTHV